MMCRTYGALVFFPFYPALTRWANFSTRLRRWLDALRDASMPTFAQHPERSGSLDQTQEMRPAVG